MSVLESSKKIKIRITEFKKKQRRKSLKNFQSVLNLIDEDDERQD